MVFSALFIPPCQSTSEVNPLYPCAWQTKFLSVLSQYAMQRCFHVRLMKISIDSLEGKPSIVRKRTEKSTKKKLGVLWFFIVRNKLRHLVVHEPRNLKTVFVAPPVRHSEIGIKLKLIFHILIIYLLLFM